MSELSATIGTSLKKFFTKRIQKVFKKILNSNSSQAGLEALAIFQELKLAWE